MEYNGEAKRTTINDLDCVICFRWFPSFDRLAAHMAARHGRPTPNDPGMVELPAATGRNKAPFPERQRMAKKKAPAAKNKPAKTTGTLPPPTENENNSELNAFLKADDIGDIDESATLTLTGNVRGPQDGTYGEEIIVEVRHAKSTKDWSVRTDSPNYRMLFERFGKRPAGWKGKRVDVTIRMSRQNRPYIAIDRE